MSLPLSILDQSPVSDTETATDALQHTIELATRAEAWGYHRRLDGNHPLYGLRASPVPQQLAELFLLGTNTSRIGKIKHSFASVSLVSPVLPNNPHIGTSKEEL